MSEATDRLDELVGPQLRDHGWRPDLGAQDAAKDRATCGGCLARTYRNEECTCPNGGDAEDYDSAYEDELAKRAVTAAAATFYDPHGNHVETLEGTVDHVTTEAAGYLARMVREGYPCSVIIEPGGPDA